MDLLSLRRSLVLRHLRDDPSFVRAAGAVCPFPVDEAPADLIGWYLAPEGAEESTVFSVHAMHHVVAGQVTETLPWEDIVAYEPPWLDKAAYLRHRRLTIHTKVGPRVIRVHGLAQVLRQLDVLQVCK